MGIVRLLPLAIAQLTGLDLGILTDWPLAKLKNELKKIKFT
jgi:hypothetical protein